MEQIMILTASTGGGHNTAAKNLKCSFEERGIHCRMVDMFKETNRLSNFMMVEGYRLLVEKMPKTYGALYNVLNHKTISKIIYNLFFIHTVIRLRFFIRKYQPELVIATHPVGAQLIGKLRKQGWLHAPFMQIVTDFKGHYSYVHPEVSAYIVPSEFTKEMMVDRGADSDKIYAYGIPIRKEFYEESTNIFDADKPLHLLIMGGSMGLKCIGKVIGELLSLEIQDQLRLSVVCGNNRELYEHLTCIYEERIRDGQMRIYGFVEEMHELMQSCDLIISKPGGLTTSEAISKNIPMLIPFMIPGQEEENAEFLVDHRMAIKVTNAEQMGHHLRNLMDHPEIYHEMVANMKRLKKSYSIDNIVNLGIALALESNRTVTPFTMPTLDAGQGNI